MADEFSFSFTLTDSDDERAVEDIISQATDHSVLEQIAKLNCSTDSELPSDLEHRFRKLKSLPTPRSGNLTEGNRDSKAKSKSISNGSRESKSKLNSRSGSFSSWSVSSAEESRSVSPVRRSIGCLWCSPKKENRSVASEDDDFAKTFSTKEKKKKIMRKAMKEEEKVAKEVDKIVEWAKQASNRMMDVSAVVRDEMMFSDDD